MPVLGFDVATFAEKYDAGQWTAALPSKTFVTLLADSTMAVLKRRGYESKVDKLENGQTTPIKKGPSCSIRGWRGPDAAPTFTFQITQRVERYGVPDRIDYFPDGDVFMKEAAAVIDDVRQATDALVWNMVDQSP